MTHNASECGAPDGASAPQQAAARWYRHNRQTCPRPIIPALRDKFGLTTKQAVEAIRKASAFQEEGH